MSGLRDKARGAADHASGCPVHYDLNKAAAKAGVTGTATSGRVNAELDENADKDAPISTFKGVALECDYRLAGEPVSIESAAVEHGRAVGLMAPQISADAAMDTSELKAYLNKLTKAGLGTPVLTPSGNVATIGLPADGAGDIALVITFGVDQHTALTGHQVSGMTEELAHQAK